MSKHEIKFQNRTFHISHKRWFSIIILGSYVVNDIHLKGVNEERNYYSKGCVSKFKKSILIND